MEYFPGPDSNVPLTKGDLINILNQMVPAQWRRSMISINFQPFTKSMTEVIEYMEKLEVLEATTKAAGTKKNDKDKSEDKTGKSKSKTKKFPKKSSRNKGKKRKRGDSDSDDDRRGKYCAICKAKGGPFWTHNTEDCRILSGYQRKKDRVTQNMTKKEFQVIIESQMRRYFGNQAKGPRNKRAKTSSGSSTSSSESSDTEE